MIDFSHISLPPGGLLIGLGTDIIEVDRIRRVMLRQGERFVNRILTDEERAYCMAMAHPHKHIAARFAAKEAVSKCFTTGIGAEFGWKSASVYHGARHEPLGKVAEHPSAASPDLAVKDAEVIGGAPRPPPKPGRKPVAR